jgi:probable RNA-binding protein EIF1AD
MAGLGRRTHYRKHLTDAVLNDLPEPKDHERIAKVVATRGGNQFDILLSTTALDEDRTPQLALLPTKFHKLVWVKRGDYVIVQTGGKADGEQDDDDEKGIRFIISHILYKDQVKHLQIKGLWPEKDPEFNRDVVRGGAEDGEAEGDAEEDDDASQDEGGDGIVYSTGYEDDDENDDDLFVNTNRIAKLKVQDSDSEEDSD